ncbi:hypothetical protein DFH07DRAFT_941401 [Mycena maculata]|uniref:Uncharacterized protein n=1 Tax=Mycena maculata TaxID=230809 RepID=A0AAD7IXT5_9AGAR|nr:hypothetical protein DFH07DRAFT_941401 [Mycena maculata]
MVKAKVHKGMHSLPQLEIRKHFPVAFGPADTALTRLRAPTTEDRPRSVKTTFATCLSHHGSTSSVLTIPGHTFTVTTAASRTMQRYDFAPDLSAEERRRGSSRTERIAFDRKFTWNTASVCVSGVISYTTREIPALRRRMLSVGTSAEAKDSEEDGRARSSSKIRMAGLVWSTRTGSVQRSSPAQTRIRQQGQGKQEYKKDEGGCGGYEFALLWETFCARRWGGRPHVAETDASYVSLLLSENYTPWTPVKYYLFISAPPLLCCSNELWLSMLQICQKPPQLPLLAPHHLVTARL